MVTIAMLTGPNGLLNKATEAKIANDKAEIQDRAETEVLGSIGDNGKINWKDLKDNLETNFGLGDGAITDNGENEGSRLTFTVEKNKRSYEVDIDEKGKVTVTYEGEGTGGSTGSNIKISHEIQTEKIEEKEIPTPSGGEIKTDGNGEKFPIPSGFTYKEGNVSDGAVVTANIDESEFVWVPVKKVIAESEETAIQKETKVKIKITAKPEKDIREITNETESNIEKISNTEYKVTENGEYKFKVTTNSGKSEEYTVNVEEISENKAMAAVDPTDENNYRGLLYDFEGTTSSVMEGCTTTNSSYREPAYLTDSSKGDNNSERNAGRVTEAGLKEEYKAMIESVDKYGGFYVGEYETSLSGNKAQSKSGQTPMTASADCDNNWYEMYEKEKNYASGNGISETVGSSMIWGSQYDAMMNWMLKGSDASKVTTRFPYHAMTTTGSTEGDIMNKIYDLGYNLMEWTLESNLTQFRPMRGGPFMSQPPSGRGLDYPARPMNGGSIGSRLTLYIK